MSETGNRPFSGTVIYSEQENKVDLEVLRGADNDGVVLVSPFLTVDREFVSAECQVRGNPVTLVKREPHFCEDLFLIQHGGRTSRERRES